MSYSLRPCTPETAESPPQFLRSCGGDCGAVAAAERSFQHGVCSGLAEAEPFLAWVWNGPDSANEFIGRERELNWLKSFGRRHAVAIQVCVLRAKAALQDADSASLHSRSGSDPEHDPLATGLMCCLKRKQPAAQSATIELWREGTAVALRGEMETIQTTIAANCLVPLIDGFHHIEPHRRTAVFEAPLAQTGRKGRGAELVSGWGNHSRHSWWKIAGRTHPTLAEEHNAQAKEQPVSQSVRRSPWRAGRGVYEFLRSVLEASAGNTRPKPMILVLDDAHWIDARSSNSLSGLPAREATTGRQCSSSHTGSKTGIQSLDPTRGSIPGLCSRLTAGASPDVGVLDRNARRRPTRRSWNGFARRTARADRGPNRVLCTRADGNPRLMNEIILELRDESSYFVRGYRAATHRRGSRGTQPEELCLARSAETPLFAGSTTRYAGFSAMRVTGHALSPPTRARRRPGA